MQQRWLAVLLLFGLVFTVTPAAATVKDIDPEHEPELTLDEAEVEKIKALQSSAFPALMSDVSPDDSTIITAAFAANQVQLSFVDVNDGSTVAINDSSGTLGPLSEIRWRDANTAVYVSLDENFSPVLVGLDRTSGGVVTETLALPGFPLSLAPNASRLLVVLFPEPSEDGFSFRPIQQSPFKLKVRSPFSIPVKRSPFKRVGPTIFDHEEEDLQMAPMELVLASFDLVSQEVIPLLNLPENTIPLLPPAWSPDGSKLAFPRITLPKIGREGTPLSDVANQDSLGLLPPEKNPFLQGNVVDVFDFSTGSIQPAALKAAGGNGDLFGGVGWSTDGQTLMAQMQRPARLAGRPFPTYLFPDRSYLRFYDSNLQEAGTFQRAEIDAPYTSAPQWVSPDEIIINAPQGLSYRLFYYNRVSGEFRRVSVEDGTYYQVRSTRHSRQLIYNFSSFHKPYDVYRIGWDGTALTGLTYHNYELQQINQIRADQVTFTMRSGAKRTGYLLQPADAPFPPRNARIVVWQQGGPGGTMTNEWGAFAEQPFNLLPNFGLAMLVLPLQSREGYGPQFNNALAEGRNFGSIDIDEQAQAVQQMIRRGYAGSKGVGITGCSYGGYFASQSITRHPRLYAAANTQCTLLDLYHEWQFGFTPVVSYLEGRPPTADPAEYTRDSPIYNAVRVRTPLLIFHGTLDFLPVSLAVNFHDQIDAGDTPVEMLRFEGEGHGLRSPTSQLVAVQAQIAWFRQYLVAGKSR
jgi:dipeptidyl aminopeptidase/acylaminoacyl peptidase